MAPRAQDRIALAYARDKGYQKGGKYAPSDLGVDFTAHRDHRTATYDGVSAGYLVFRCRCAETVFVAPS
jgi:hypothetical protein